MEQYQKVAALLSAHCASQHRRDARFSDADPMNFCATPDCYIRLCEHCAGKVSPQPQGPWILWCEKHA